ncbi:TPA: glutamate racemase [Photobacterium damselae]
MFVDIWCRVKKVVIFDSGVGGLSVYQEIQARLPQAQYIYAFDNAAFPYGELPQQVLIERACHIITNLVARHQADLVVVACNTASTIVLPALRQQLTIPVVGVVPAIKPAAQASLSKSIGLLATPATVERPYTHDLVKQFAQDCQVLMLGTTRLVEMAEEKLQGEVVSLNELTQILAPWLGKVDTIVLGCTHFPLMRAEIQQVCGAGVTIIDSGKAIANRVVSLLPESATQDAALEEMDNLTYCSAKPTRLDALNKSLQEMKLGAIQCLNYPYF